MKLRMDTLYSDEDGFIYSTPDGVGAIWHDTLEEARAQTGLEGKLVYKKYFG